MKRIICLILALALTLTALCGVTMAAKVDNIADAKVTLTAGDGTVTYWNNLETGLMAEAAKLPGTSTITLLQDLNFVDNETDNMYIRIPHTGYPDNNPDANPIVLDMAGHTISYSGGPANLFTCEGDSNFTVKNGTIIYTCEGNTRVPFQYGTSSGAVGDWMTGEAYTAVLNLENVKLYNLTAKAGRIVNTFLWTLEVNAKDCVLWTDGTGQAAFEMRKGGQSNAITPYTGEHNCVFNFENTVIGSATADHAVFKAADKTTVNMTNSKIVATGALVDGSVTIQSQYEATTEAWSSTKPDGTAISGNATVYAPKAAPETPAQPTTPAVPETPVAPTTPTTPTTPSVPTTNIPDVSVPTTGVSVVALGVMALVSLAGAAAAKKH